MTFNQKVVAGLAAGAAVVASSGVAFAFWSSSGSVDGSSTTTNPASDVIVVAQTTGASNLAPGHAAETLSGTVTNPAASANKFYVAQVVASIKSVTKDPNAVAGTCDASDYTLSNATMTVGSDLAPGASANFSGATLAFNDKATNQDQCKGAIVTITYTAS
jgi:hypothetical protein